MDQYPQRNDPPLPVSALGKVKVSGGVNKQVQHGISLRIGVSGRGSVAGTRHADQADTGSRTWRTHASRTGPITATAGILRVAKRTDTGRRSQSPSRACPPRTPVNAVRLPSGFKSAMAPPQFYADYGACHAGTGPPRYRFELTSRERKARTSRRRPSMEPAFPACPSTSTGRPRASTPR